jgi:hypothetical protein
VTSKKKPFGQFVAAVPVFGIAVVPPQAVNVLFAGTEQSMNPGEFMVFAPVLAPVLEAVVLLQPFMP